MRTPSILDQLGVFGCDAIEDAVLAGLALGDPILLIGAQGSAKTTLAERLAAAMGRGFWAYDASKAMFEDVVGFPDPRSMQEGRIAYLQTPLTLWDKQFVLIDELSRASIGMQNKWLEVIRSRRVMGMALPALKFVLAAMNPVGMLGTSPLDEALAGRFTFLIDVPEIREMNPADRRKVIENRTSADAVAMEPTLPLPCPEDLPDVETLLVSIRAHMAWAESRVGAAASTYADLVGAYLDAKEIHLDGRRLGMIRRALVALVAVHRATGRLSPKSAGIPLDLFRHGLDVTMPFRAVGRPVGRLVIDGAHSHASATLSGSPRRSLPHSNLLAAARGLLADPAAFADGDGLSLLVTRVAGAVEHPTKVEPALQAGAALVLLVSRPDVLARVRPEARHRLLSCWREVATLSPDRGSEFAGRMTAGDFDSRLPAAVLAGVLRIAFQLAGRLDRQPSVNCNFEDFAPKMLALVEQGGDA
jgi:MoxR-like ATPase